MHLPRRHRRRLGIGRLVVGLCGRIGAPPSGFCIAGLARRALHPACAASFLSSLIVLLVVLRFLGHRLAHRDAIVDAEHDDDGVGLFGGEDALERRPPNRRVRPWADIRSGPTRCGACGSRQYRAVRRRRLPGHRRASPPCRRQAPGRCAPARIAFLRRRRPGKILAGAACGACCWNGAKKSPPNQPPPPPRGGAGPRGRETAEIEELRRSRSRDADKNAIATASTISGPVSVNMRKKDFGFDIRLGRNGREGVSIIAESGRKRADFSTINRAGRTVKGGAKMLLFRVTFRA